MTTSCRSGYRDGCTVLALRNWLQVRYSKREADGSQNGSILRHSVHRPLSLGTRFRRQSRAPQGAPLTGKGIDRSARPSKRGLSCQECQKSPPLLIRTGDIGDNLGAERVVEWLEGPLLELDVAEIVVHEADEPNVIVDLLNTKHLTGERG